MQLTGVGAACHGPIPQAQFLLGLGMEARLHQLLESASEEQAEGLVAGFRWAGRGEGESISRVALSKAPCVGT